MPDVRICIVGGEAPCMTSMFASLAQHARKGAMSPFALSLLFLLCILTPGAWAQTDPAGSRPASTPKPAPGTAPAAANTWFKASEETSGGRDTPLFAYAPGIRQFILSGGIHKGARHFDTELFDPAAGRWINAYPAGAPYRKESGPTDAPGSGDDGWPKKPFQTDSNTVTRIRMDGQNAAYGTDTRLHHQFAFNPEDNKLYVYFFDRTATYDPVARRWDELPAAKFSKTRTFSLMYGSLAHDPVNKGILSLGGTSDEPGGSPGTWAFSPASGEWKKVDGAAKELKDLATEAHALREQAQAFVNACRNRFHLTETSGEAAAKLSARAGAVAATAEALAARLAAAAPAAHMASGRAVATAALARLGPALKALAPRLDSPPDSAGLLEAQAAADLATRAARALDTEPCGRAHSQMATDPANGRIVLFGGSRLDGFLSDTWIYDGKTRTWEQRHPEVVPTPRAGHTLAWLPRAGQVLLSGGYDVKGPVGPDLWVYDIPANRWKRLSVSGPGPDQGPGAVGPDDTLFVVGADPKKSSHRITWACRVDATAADAGSATQGVAAATIALKLPAEDYDKVARPDAAAVAAAIDSAPANRWTLLPKPPKGTARRDWGTLPYDTDRQQILHWGGGHSTYIGTDVAHYSLRAATWSLGYAAENPPTRGFYAMANQSFNNRPHVPNHVWDSAAYDPVSKKGVWLVRGGTWTYDPARREWDYPPAPRLHPKASELGVALAATPRGVVCWYNEGLHLFTAATGTWTNLPIDGGKVGGAYGDTSGLCFDSKRNSLWLSHRGGPMMQYAMDSGKLTTTPVTGAAGVFMRETVYIPELDMLLNMMRAKGPGGEIGNLAYDIEAGKWVGLELPFANDQPYLPKEYFATTGSRSLHYDPTRKVAIFLYESDELWIARFDKATLKTFEVKLAEPKKK